jgi:ABC-type Zn2+ transport system substrate-binding protein/surface adhesin
MVILLITQHSSIHLNVSYQHIKDKAAAMRPTSNQMTSSQYCSKHDDSQLAEPQHQEQYHHRHHHDHHQQQQHHHSNNTCYNKPLHVWAGLPASHSRLFDLKLQLDLLLVAFV